MQTSPHELRARQIVASRSTASLCEMFEALGDPKSPKFLEESTVRGWIMDELEKRAPEAFEAWLDCTDPLAHDAERDSDHAFRSSLIFPLSFSLTDYAALSLTWGGL